MRRHKRWPLRPLASALIRSRFSSTAEIATTPTTTEAFPLKHVTRSNFETTLNDLRTHVKAADFVAIDLEMTGVTSAPWRDSLEFDRYDVRYLKVKDSAEKFAVVQFGVCPFRWDSLTHSFLSHPLVSLSLSLSRCWFISVCNYITCVGFVVAGTTSLCFLVKSSPLIIMSFSARPHPLTSLLSINLISTPASMKVPWPCLLSP